MYSLLFVPTSFSRTVGRCLSKLHWPQKLPQDLRCEPQIEKFGLSRLRSRYPCIQPGHLIAAVPELEMMRNAGFSKSKADRWLSLLVENRLWDDTRDDDERIRQQVQYKSALGQKETKTFSKLLENSRNQTVGRSRIFRKQPFLFEAFPISIKLATRRVGRRLSPLFYSQDLVALLDRIACITLKSWLIIDNKFSLAKPVLLPISTHHRKHLNHHHQNEY